jgi:hypothetical protein
MMMTTSSDAARVIERRQMPFLIVGVVGLIAWAALGHGSVQFFRSYLFAFEFCVSFPLGCLAILMVHHLTGGWWGLPIRRVLEAGSRTFPLMTVLFLPLLFGLPKIYDWAQPDMVAADDILKMKQWYLNQPGFIIRAAVYFAIWNLLTYILNRMSREQDRTGDPALAGRMSALSGPGIILWALCVSGAAVDWVMSLEPHWFSTIYGFLFIVFDLLVALSFCIFVVRMLSDREPIKGSVEPSTLLDLGNLTLAFVLLMTYLSFDQLLIIWAGNLKNEIPWYTQRVFGSWAFVAVILIVLHFFVPFFLLLQRGVKRRLRVLSTVSISLIAISLVNMYWIMEPAYDVSGPRFHVLDLCALAGIGGLWLWAFFGQLKKLPLLPLHDTRFAAVLEPEHGD